VAEAKKRKQAPSTALVPATTAPNPDILPNRTGFVQGVPRGGFGVDAAESQTGAAQNTTRTEWLQALWEEYLRCPWAWACVNVIARTVTAGGLGMKWDGDTGEGDVKQPVKPAAVLAVERLFAFANPVQDIRQLCRNIVADLQVFGGAMVEVVWFAGIPAALYNQDFPTTVPEADEHGNVKGYKQTTEDGRTAKFRAEQIIHITLDSARPSIFGISPTHAAEESIVAWMFLHACEKEAARRGLPPNIHADHPAGTPETDVQRWQNQYATRNIGPANIGTPIVTKGGGHVSELQQTKLPDILLAKKEARNEIVSSYGVPPAKVGIIESGNLGGGTGSDQNKSFWLDIIAPSAALIAEKLQFAIAVKGFGVTGWHVDFGGVDYRDDQTIENIRDMRMRNGSWTRNRYAADIGEPPVEGGDDAVLVARQDIVLWADMKARSAASVAALARLDAVDNQAGGPPPAAGTGRPSGTGGARDPQPPSESAAVAEAVVLRLVRSGVLEARGGAKRAAYRALRSDFPPGAVAWAKDADWSGPAKVPVSRIDTSNKQNWAAWGDDANISHFRKQVRKGTVNPVTLVRRPGVKKLLIPDGHHRLLAAMEEGEPVLAYIATVGTVKGPWDAMHRAQRAGPSEAAEAVAEHTAKLTARQRAYNQLARNFAAKDLTWVDDATWTGPVNVGTDQIDFADKDQWNAQDDRAKVARIRKRIRKTGAMKPAILIRGPGHEKDVIADGHHHVLAAVELGFPVRAYVAHVNSATGPWTTLSTRQRMARAG
jgi:phage portal protein BeeE